MLEKLVLIIKDKTNIEPSTITKDSVLLSDLGMNSLDLVNLVCDVEDEFDVEIPDREIRKFKTVGDVIEFIEKQ